MARIDYVLSAKQARRKSGVKVRYQGGTRTVYFNQRGHYIIDKKNARVYIRPEPGRGMFVPGVPCRRPKRRPVSIFR